MAEEPIEYFRDEKHIKEEIDKAKIVEFSEIAITDADVSFFKDGQMKYDKANNRFVIRVDGKFYKVDLTPL